MKQQDPDGPRFNFALAIVAQMLPALFPFDPLAFGLETAQKFGDIAYYRLGPLRIYQLTHPDLARQILVEQPEKFYKPSILKRAFRPFAGEGLVTSDGALWKQQRKLIAPAFHHRQMAAYGDIMVAHATRLCDSFTDGEVRDIGADMPNLTLGIVVHALFGTVLAADAGEIRQSTSAMLDAANQRLNKPLRPPAWVPTRRNLREKRALSRLDGVLNRLIHTRRASPESHHDLLSILLAAVDEDSGVRMSDQQLRDEMMTIFLAGHETTASALTWTWYLLSRHPEVEARLLEELRHALSGRTPTMTDLPQLPYADMVIREAIRLYPPAPGAAREPIEDVVIGGYNVPKGSLVMVNTYALHRDERFFADPERFDPERFAPGWEERIPRHAYLPFGGGPRICIGNGFAMMEARLVLATMAQRYKLSLESPDEIKPVQLVTIRPGGPVRMRLQRIN